MNHGEQFRMIIRYLASTGNYFIVVEPSIYVVKKLPQRYCGSSLNFMR